MLIPKKITPELAEETGWHIGDGSMNYYKNCNNLKGLYQLRGHIQDDKPHYDYRIKEIFKRLYNLDINLRKMHGTGVYGFQIWSDKLVNFKSKIGLPLGKKTSIIIPKIFLKEGELIIPIIRGIFDTDGCLYLEKKNNKFYPRIKITTVSKPLADQLKYEINEIGIRATKYSMSRSEVGWNTLHNIEIMGKNEAKKWFRIIKPKNPKFLRKFKLYLNS